MKKCANIQFERYRARNTQKKIAPQGPVVYWMNREMRLEDNWALLRAQFIAHAHDRALCIVYNIVPNYLGGGRRQWEFKKAALQEIEQDARKKGIGFSVVLGEEKELEDFFCEQKVAYIVTDFCPLRISQTWVSRIALWASVPVEEVDAHNIVPCWTASSKQEFAAYTLRPKIQKLLEVYLEDFPRLISMKQEEPFVWVDWDFLERSLVLNEEIVSVDWIRAGEKAANQALKRWIERGIAGYDEARNDPNANAQSNLSPYLHYGMIAPQRVALTIKHAGASIKDREAFLDELIVRRELSDNFCFYNSNYDSEEGFPEWAKKSLQEHAWDKREYLYSMEDFQNAKTHDELWNAAQREMVFTGKMHGYMRMYWAKKILEWTKDPKEAMRIAITLNDAYELDGRDPSGYAGIAWSIGGVHDRAWFDRPIFGKIRYMNANGAKKKFDVEKYILKNRVKTKENM